MAEGSARDTEQTEQENDTMPKVIEKFERTRSFELDEEPEIGETVTFKSLNGWREETVDGVEYDDDGTCQLHVSGGYIERSWTKEYSVEGTDLWGRLDNGAEVRLEERIPDGTVQAREESNA